MRALRGLLAPALAMTVIAAALPATASAGTVSRAGTTYTFQAAPGETNDVRVYDYSDDWAYFEHSGAPISAGLGCRPNPSYSYGVLCEKSGPRALDNVVVRLGDGNDKAHALAWVYATLYGDDGNDQLEGESQTWALHGGPGDDDLQAGGYLCTMTGGPGADWMRGATEPDEPGGEGGVSYADHKTGVTVVVDGIANDGNATDGPVGERDNVIAVETVIGSPGDDHLTDGPGVRPHRLSGRAGNDVLVGLEGSDSLYGGPGTDELYGGPGGDTLMPDYRDDDMLLVETDWGPDDVVSGGPDQDRASYGRTTAVRVSLDGVANDGADADGNGDAEESDNFMTDVEDVSTGSGDDVISGNARPNVLGGNAGADRISGGGDDDTLYGLAGDDTLAAGAANDLVVGGDGHDLLDGGSGNDRLSGEAGDDGLDGGTGADAMGGGDGADSVSYASRTSPLVVTMAGGADDGVDTDGDGAANEGDDVGATVETLFAGSGADDVTGNALANRIVGAAGADDLKGLSANDVLDAGTGGDSVGGGPGNDTFPQAKSADGPDLMVGGTGVDTADYSARGLGIAVTLDGTANDGARSVVEGDDVRADVEAVLGGFGADLLTGAPIDNRLVGGVGDDILDGGLGADDLTGGDGADTVTYASRTGAVTADLDGLADDGTTADANALGVRDRIRTDVERLTGGTGADRLTGNAAANQLSGGNGPDILTGGGAVDLLYGGDGDDDLFSRGDGAADTAACQGGTADEVTADAADTVSGCEIAH